MKTTFLLLFILFGAVFAKAQDLYELSSINFNGNNSVSASILKKIISSEETPFWFFKFIHTFTNYGSEPVYFDSTNISKDINAIEKYYMANGYFKVKIVSSYQIDTSAKTAVLNYEISENQPSRYGLSKIYGFSGIPQWIAGTAIDIIKTDSSEQYNQVKIEAKANEAVEYLTRNGFMMAAYDSSEVMIDTSQNRANISYYFTAGEMYIIKKLNVVKTGEGKGSVSDSLIKEVAALNPGQLYNSYEIKQSQNRLFRTGLFNSISLKEDIKDTTGNSVPLNIEGNIGKINELSPEVLVDNYQNTFNFGLGAGYVRKNFLGDARKLTLKTKASIYDAVNYLFTSKKDKNLMGAAEVSLKLEQPYMFNRPITGSLETYMQAEKQYSDHGYTYGGKLNFDFEMPEYVFVNQLKPYFNVEYLELLVNDQTIDSIFVPLDINYHSLTSYVGVEFGSVKSNDLYYPTKGTNLLFKLETAVSNTKFNITGNELPDFEIVSHETGLFYKAEFTTTSYFALDAFQTSVAAMKFKIGHIQTYKGGDELVPPNRTFFVGGSNSVRGRRAKELGPLSKENRFISLNDTIRGGTFEFEGSFEYRRKFFETFGAVLFLDYGNAWNGYHNFRFDEIALAAGFGFRYYSSIAPFRVDLGFKVYDPSDKTFIFNKPVWQNFEFHFGIGEAF